MILSMMASVTGLYVLEVDWESAETRPSGSPLPAGYHLAQKYPNPFNPLTTLEYDLPERSTVILTICDLQGGEVARLVEGHHEAGYHQVVWNGTIKEGGELPSGIYIARLVTPDYTQSIKMVLLK